MVVEGLLDSNSIMLKWLDSWLDSWLDKEG